MKHEVVIVGALETNCYLAYCEETRECAVIDPGSDPEKIFAAIVALELRPVVILNTHGHIDHVGANSDLKTKYGVPLAVHAADLPFLQAEPQMELSLLLGAKASPAPDRLLADGDEVQVGLGRFKVVHTPGHTPGSVGFLADGHFFSGDTLFLGGVGRTDLPGGSWKDLEASIRERILTLPDETVVLPGHGPWTTVGDEKGTNPFFT